MKLLHVDARLLVIDKPAGLLSVPGRTEPDCALHRLQQDHPEALTVHRLDQPTSGLLLFARGPEWQRRLSAEFAERRVEKRYLAVVDGLLQAEGWQLIDLPLAADWPRRPRQQVDTVHGKPSQTRWRLLSHVEGRSRLELEPLTGRTHQLRVHLAAIGHPILGDTLYGDAEAQAQRLHLHASELRVLDLHLTSPAPF